jgi:hypothetical protein
MPRDRRRLSCACAASAAGQAVVTVISAIIVSAGVFARGPLTEPIRIVLPWQEGLRFWQMLGLFPEAPAGLPC